MEAVRWVWGDGGSEVRVGVGDGGSEVGGWR